MFFKGQLDDDGILKIRPLKIFRCGVAELNVYVIYTDLELISASVKWFTSNSI